MTIKTFDSVEERNSKKSKGKEQNTESHCEQTAFENRVSTHLVENGTLEPGINREQYGFGELES